MMKGLRLLLTLWVLLSVSCIPTVANSETVLQAEVIEGVAKQTHNQAGWLPIKLVFAFQGKNYTTLMQINSEAYNKHNQRTRKLINSRNYFQKAVNLVIKGKVEVAPLAQALKKASPTQSPEGIARFTLAFVQSLPYQLDALTTISNDTWRWPLQTLVDVENDCEDSSILYASLLSIQAIDSSLILVPGHMLTAVSGDFTGDKVSDKASGKTYYMAETTGLGWKIGVMPSGHRLRDVTGLSIDATPASKLLVTVKKRQARNKTKNTQKVQSSGPPAGLLIGLIFILLIVAAIWFAWERGVFTKTASRDDDDDRSNDVLSLDIDDDTGNNKDDWKSEYDYDK